MRVELPHIKGGTQVENKVVMNIFGPKRYELKGYWRGLHNEKL
jgi:hypothetical protein